jgi:2-keto-4-pentenoate hydratase
MASEAGGRAARSDRGAGGPAEVDARAAEAIKVQLEDWRAALASGAERVGWKIGLNIPEVQERLGLREPVIGHLTSATRLESGGDYPGGEADELRAEPEVAIEVGRDVPGDADSESAREAIAGYGAAIELVDVGRPPADLEGIVAGNVFHRGFVLGASQPALPAEGVEAVVSVNGDERDRADAPDDFAEVVMLVARLLDAVGERLSAGDRIIAGSLTPPVAVGPGDDVAVDLGRLGRVEVHVT